MNNYNISGLKDLDLIRENPNDSFKLLNHIDLSDEEFFSPVEEFNGLLDGNGYEIRNLRINDNTVFYGKAGLFRVIYHCGLIKNLTMRNVYIHSGHGVGSLAAINHGKIINCSVVGKNTIKGGDYTGGLVGVSDYGGYIENVFISIRYLEGFNKVGGLVGCNKSRINNCTVIAEGDMYKYKNKLFSPGTGIYGINGVGGLVGVNSGIIKKNVSFFSIHGDKNIGGLVGIEDYGNKNRENCAMSRVVDCKSFGIIMGKENMGGSVGFNDFSVIDSCVSDVQFNTRFCNENIESIGSVIGLNKEGWIFNCKQEKNICNNFLKKKSYFYFDNNIGLNKRK